jgi:hypothetical protein
VSPYRSRSLTPQDRLARAKERHTALTVEKREADTALRPLEARYAREILKLESELAAAESRRDLAISWQAVGKGKEKKRQMILSVDDSIARVEALRVAVEDHPVTHARRRLQAANEAWLASRREVADLESVVREMQKDGRRK